MLRGNEAITLGVVEQGCPVVTSHPCAPGWEILACAMKYKVRLARQVHNEWSFNERR